MATEAELQRRAGSGDAEAQVGLAVLLDRRGQHEQALQWLQTASRKGHAAAQYMLGARLIVGRAAPFQPAEGARWVSVAARQGMPEALALMSVLSTVSGEWPAAIQFMADAAGRGLTRAREQVALLRDPAQFDVQEWNTPRAPHWRFESPSVGVLEDFVPKALCDWIIRRAKSKLEATRVKDPVQGSREVDYRNNAGAGFSLIESDLILQMVNIRVAHSIGLPLANQEPTNVLRYLPGEEYKPHFDFITHSVQHETELRQSGQRSTTVLIYLNDGYAGGETEFPRLGWRFKGKVGDALVFRNLTAEGEPDQRTLHAGLPPTSGEKWLYSKWVRERPFPVV
jgi:hypothetical protein